MMPRQLPGMFRQGWKADVGIGLVFGALSSSALIGMMALGADDARGKLMQQVRPILDGGPGVDYFGCQICAKKERFKCALFFDCMANVLNDTNPTLRVENFVVFGTIDVCGIRLVSGLMADSWAPRSSTDCVPAMTKGQGAVQARYLRVLGFLATWVHHVSTTPKPGQVSLVRSCLYATK